MNMLIGQSGYSIYVILIPVQQFRLHHHPIIIQHSGSDIPKIVVVTQKIKQVLGLKCINT